MLIKLSNNYYINPEKITCITPRVRLEGRYEERSVTEWHITFDSENSLILSQAHFDELLSCLPEPRDAITMAEARKASDRWKEIMDRVHRGETEERTT